MKSLPLPRDVENSAIAYILRTYTPATARNGVGGPLSIPPPPRTLRRSDSDHAKCGGVSITDSVFSVSLKCIGLAGKTRFFAPNFLTDKRRGMYFGPLLGGTGAHILLFAIASGFRVTRVIVEFRRKFGIFFCKSGPRYSCQNFIPDGP